MRPGRLNLTRCGMGVGVDGYVVERDLPSSRCPTSNREIDLPGSTVDHVCVTDT